MQRSIFLTTCARCGTHWVERILWGTLGLQTCTRDWAGESQFAELVARVAQIEQARPGGRLYVRHQPLDTLIPIRDQVDVLALIRDPRDVLVSVVHYYMTKQGTRNEARITSRLGIADLTQARPIFNALLTEIHNGYWFDGYFAGSRQVDHSLIRYEDMIEAPVDTLSLALERLGVEHDPARLAGAVGHWTFEQLSGGRHPGQENPQHHYRKGVVGDWKNYFTPEQNARYFGQARRYFEAFGYTLEGVC